ncbi:MAG: hypothetical protein ABR600_13845 [Actinomycetota bacterium]
MLRRALALIPALVLFGVVAGPSTQAGPLSPAGAQPAPLTYIDPGPGGFMSPNISYVATLANESPGVSARVVQVGAVKRLYVSSAKGLSVYNVTNPAVPLLMGALYTHNWENEDVAVSADGHWVLMSDFEGILYLIVIHVQDLPGGLVSLTVEGKETAHQGNHTIECVDASPTCDWAYGSEGKIYDLRDKANPTYVGEWKSAAGGRTGHHVTRDATGLIWTDTTPIYALNVSDPAQPVEVAHSDASQMGVKKTAYQHNNLRPYAAEYKPRITDEDKADPNLRPGELLLGEGETNFSPSCNSGSGPFTTYSLRDFDQPGAKPFKPIDVFRPVQGNYQDGNPEVNGLGCSGHWFDISSDNSTHDHIVTANGWYEHGTRIFDVDGKTGKIKQLGFFQPVVGSTSSAYWIDKNYIYSVDYERGVDILKYDPSKNLVPSKAQFRASWLAKLGVNDPVAAAERYLCRRAATGRNT